MEVAVIICASVTKAAVFWLCVTQPSFPPLPIPSLMEAKLQLSSGFLCVCLLISAPLSSFHHYNHYFSWHEEAVCQDCFSLSFSMYLSMYLFTCLSISLSVFLVSLPVCFLVYQSCSLSLFSPIPISFVPHHKHAHAAVRFGQLGWFVGWYLVLSLMLKSDKHGNILMCSTRLLQLATFKIPPVRSGHITHLEI